MAYLLASLVVLADGGVLFLLQAVTLVLEGWPVYSEYSSQIKHVPICFIVPRGLDDVLGNMRVDVPEASISMLPISRLEQTPLLQWHRICRIH